MQIKRCIPGIVVCGVVDTSPDVQLLPTVADLENGLVCNGNRTIRASDRIIFVGETATFGTVQAPKQPEPTSGKRRSKIPQVPRIKHVHGILVCGWREAWNDGKALVDRIAGMALSLAEGSTIHFLNLRDPEEFAECLEDDRIVRLRDDEGRWSGWNISGILVRHSCGDALDENVLTDVLSSAKFESAIIMGTTAGITMSAQSRDRRVLATMLLLRMVHAELNKGDSDGFHVVSVDRDYSIASPSPTLCSFPLRSGIVSF